VINQRWSDIVEIKEDGENFDEANRRIEIVKNAFAVSYSPYTWYFNLNFSLKIC
jgi:hypothetical protein